MKLATVITASPLTVRRDGDAVDVPAKPTAVTVAVDDRVLTVNLDSLIYVIARLTG
jgi:hypothetical protein